MNLRHKEYKHHNFCDVCGKKYEDGKGKIELQLPVKTRTNVDGWYDVATGEINSECRASKNEFLKITVDECDECGRKIEKMIRKKNMRRKSFKLKERDDNKMLSTRFLTRKGNRGFGTAGFGAR